MRPLRNPKRKLDAGNQAADRSAISNAVIIEAPVGCGNAGEIYGYKTDVSLSLESQRVNGELQLLTTIKKPEPIFISSGFPYINQLLINYQD